jgi:hypothetical protein
MRQFRRLQCIQLKTSAQRHVPREFMTRMLRAHREWPWTAYSQASIVHRSGCGIRRGGRCNCTPEVLFRMPDGAIVEIDAAGRVRQETSH